MAAHLGGINSWSSSADAFICAVVEASIAASRMAAVHKTAVIACTGQTRAALRDALGALLASLVVIRWSTAAARQLNTGLRRVVRKRDLAPSWMSLSFIAQDLITRLAADDFCADDRFPI